MNGPSHSKNNKALYIRFNKCFMQARWLFTLMILTATIPAFAQTLAVNGLTCEYQRNPVGIDIMRPRFSWKLTSSQRNTMQTAYELRVGSSAEALAQGKDLVYQTGKVSSDRSTFVEYEGPQLRSRMRYFWQVRVWDDHGNTSAWSPVNYWEMALLDAADWTAKWIGTPNPADTVNGPSPLFRTTFNLSKPVRSARLYITSHGVYECFINGRRVGNDHFTPGWTSYKNRLQYQTYDVTTLLTSGTNATGAVLGDGWYRGQLEKWKNIYGKELALLYQLEITHTDGSKTTINSDGKWKTSEGAIRSSSFYDGEVYDTRFEKKGWDLSTYNDKAWRPVKMMAADQSKLIAPVGPPVKKHEVFHPAKLIITPQKDTVIDFGQNLVGWVTLKMKGRPNQIIKLEHAEVLDKAGNFYTLNLRGAKCQNKFVLKGDAERTYEPHFTYQGFRYVRIKGYGGKVDTSKIRAVALYSDMAPTGTLVTSNPLLNQLQHNIQWGQKGNFVDVPTDCPQRDERLGWTGDAQAFSRTAAYNMNVNGFFSKWLKDLSIDQREDGAVPWTIPNMMPKTSAGVAGWSDVSTIVPWNMYLVYGDKRLLEQQYASMKAWVGYIQSVSVDNLWNTGFQFGDWCFYSPSPTDDSGKAAVTDKTLIAEAFYAHSTQIMIDAARVLGKDDDVKRYSDLLKEIKKAFMKEYVTPNGRTVSSTQTAYLLALQFDLLPEDQRQQLADRLVKNISDYGNHLTTGFLGTPYLCHVLTRFGHDDIAYTLLLQDTYPSWLYPVKKGATTIWERWDGIKANGDLQDPSMNSFNHYSYGAIGDWMYRVMAGINTDDVRTGYKRITIAPHPGGNLKMVNAQLETGYGQVSSKWTLNGDVMNLTVTVPVNTTALIVLPKAAQVAVTEGDRPVKEVDAIRDIKKDGQDLKLEVGSGTYNLKYNMARSMAGM
ncbi:glycoside hydrolase family 78 protein [Mucilaginibacter daejeonensis]|uniref:alpha-L-rhamnosidase n=1 Tax=Mucilaginibacter daejeonensis TaxID=398049 RepID=UPI001D175626|nr:alpha-L-rhamnosidase [Mucilaginibacter daejeonensis]UEG54972.1 glycoside hydrolase family 78 protein [Mucilaginibacter daejeonensis]